MSKKTLYQGDARAGLLKGVKGLTDAVKSTLGPMGRPALIQRKYGLPIVTKDGITVAKEYDPADPLEKLGADSIRQATQKTADQAGDGTTTATVLACSIIEQGMAAVEAGANPVMLKKGIDIGVEIVVKQLESQRLHIKGDNARIQQIATVSANNDEEIGRIIAEAYAKVGAEGIISIEESASTETSVTTKEGLIFDRGYIIPKAVNNANLGAVVYENPFILCVEGKVKTFKQVESIIGQVTHYKEKRPLIIIAENIEGEALDTILTNIQKAGLMCCPVKWPGFQDRGKERLEDIAVMLGATIIGPSNNLTMEQANISHCGQADLIQITRDNTTILGQRGKPEAIEAHIETVKAQLVNSESEYNTEKLTERLGMLTGKAAVLNIAAATEIEMGEKQARVEDALKATKAAIDEGILAGGGLALSKCTIYMDIKDIDNMHEDTKKGIEILHKAIFSPLEQIILNTGSTMNEVYRKADHTNNSSNYGYNALTGEFCDLMEAGIVDPFKVTKQALINAASAAGTLITAECAMYELPEPKSTMVIPGDY